MRRGRREWQTGGVAEKELPYPWPARGTCKKPSAGNDRLCPGQGADGHGSKPWGALRAKSTYGNNPAGTSADRTWPISL